jgi:hypothetical protein
MTGKLYIPDLREAAINRPAGYLDEVLVAGRIENEIVLHIDMDVYHALVHKYSPKQLPSISGEPMFGPGTELKKLIAKLGLKPASNCKCNARMLKMNVEGIEWCEQNIDTIVGWLKEEAERAQLSFSAIAAKLIIKHAIRNASRKSGR